MNLPVMLSSATNYLFTSPAVKGLQLHATLTHSAGPNPRQYSYTVVPVITNDRWRDVIPFSASGVESLAGGAGYAEMSNACKEYLKALPRKGV